MIRCVANVVVAAIVVAFTTACGVSDKAVTAGPDNDGSASNGPKTGSGGGSGGIVGINSGGANSSGGGASNGGASTGNGGAGNGGANTSNGGAGNGGANTGNGGANTGKGGATGNGGANTGNGGATGTVSAGCAGYCTANLTNCTGANKQFDSANACHVACAKFPTTGNDGDTTGNTLQCRVYHTNAAAGDPVLHCPHTGVTPTAYCK